MRLNRGPKNPLLFLLASLTLACSEAVPAKPDLAAEEQAIREVDARWLAAFQAHDAADEAAVFASDGVEYRARLEPIVGPEAIQAYDEVFFAENATLDVSWSTDEIHVAESGELAIQTGSFHAKGVGPTGQDEDWGRILTVWKKEDGQWKVAHAMVSPTKPLSADTDE